VIFARWLPMGEDEAIVVADGSVDAQALVSHRWHMVGEPTERGRATITRERVGAH
jgi:hypothetical protein